MSKVIFNINQPNPNDHIINKEKVTRLKGEAFPASKIKSAEKVKKKHLLHAKKPLNEKYE